MDSSSRELARRGVWCGLALTRGKKLIGHDHDRLGQVEGGALPGGDGDQGVAEGQLVVGEAPVFRPEEQGDVVDGGNIHQAGGYLPGREIVVADAPQPGGGTDDVLKRLEGLGQIVVDLHPVQESLRRAGGHHGHAVPVQVQGRHRHQAVDPHVAGGPGHRADVLGQPGLKEDDGHPLQAHPGGPLHPVAFLLHGITLAYPLIPANRGQ